MTPDTIVIENPNLEKFRAMLAKTTGITLPQSKNHLVEGRLRKRVAALNLPDITAYLSHLFDEGGLDQELPGIVDLMSTNRTEFFREAPHFEFLAKQVLPHHDKDRLFKIWSAASSSGEEAYSIAMLLSEYSRRSPGFNFGVLGTDISKSILSKADAGEYQLEGVRSVPKGYRDRYFQLVNDTTIKVKNNLKSRVKFGQLNLIEGNFPVDRNIDAIFLRNVLIYFDVPTRAFVVSALTDHLRTGGYLFVGHSEAMAVDDPRLTARTSAVFQKVNEA
ncbi:CheR family methyltransferase [Pseudoprimorskyibacter insulae]|uniref:Chemotaxis protein methyltransferase n=1 Tax=Pseudoprimorskyibacter insulae TaxID=1695997 RepID=A0A2R8ANG2_9RHOB|nr:CheR family methyltransferase [Pseudoprimorskyibacter insulae]SPF77591.1 Chemotaxis protein methyltransferase [Pseudoprimorskyibacter insulae]